MGSNRQSGNKKIEIVLTAPAFTLKDNFGLLDFVGQYGAPVNLLYLAASLENAGFPTEVADLSYETKSIEECARQIVDMDPEFVAVAIHFTFLADRSLRLVSAIKRLAPSLKIIAGGAHFTALPEETMRVSPGIDIGILGEAEEAIVDIVRCFRQNSEIKNIRGLIVRSREGLFVTEARGLIDDINKLPFPAFDKIDLLRYSPALHKGPKGLALPITTSRGCPFACSFCDRTVLGDKVRFYDIGYLERMVAALLEKHKVRLFDLVDENICITKDRLNDICRLFRDKFLKYDIRWGCSMRADSVGTVTGKMLYAAGCRSVTFGIESASAKMLTVYNKKIDLKNLPERCKIITDAGISLTGSFIIGGPDEDEKSIAETVELVRKIRLDYIFVWYFIPLPGSPLYRNIEEKGILVGDYSNRTGHCISFIPKTLTRLRLEAGYRSIYRAFYSRPEVIWRAVRKEGFEGIPHIFDKGIKYLRRFS